METTGLAIYGSVFTSVISVMRNLFKQTNTMNIKVNLADGTPAQFKTEIIDGSLVVTVVSEEEQEKVNLFPKWEDLGEISGYCVKSDSEIGYAMGFNIVEGNQNVFSTEDLAKAALATARVSQTYRRYRELIGDLPTSIIWHDEYSVEATVIKLYGLLRMTFANSSDWEEFYKSNKEDLKAILYASSNSQL